MSKIMVYVEGGGDQARQRRELRLGLGALFSDVEVKAKKRSVAVQFIPCGKRNEAYKEFVKALDFDSEKINVLLVDSEDPIVDESSDIVDDARFRVAHLAKRDGWDLSRAHPERVHLMVQCMETWIVADAEALEKLYGPGFASSVLPKRNNLEDEAKNDVSDKLKKATEKTQRGEYHKIRHVREILQRIDPDKVAARCPRFRHFRDTLETILSDARGELRHGNEFGGTS